jgi:signal peptidase
MATMLTGSMAPGIKPGDVVIDTQEDAADIAVGQIITYHVPIADHRVESHRVTWVGHDSDGTVLIRTRGDANDADDPWTARIDTAKVWRVRAVVPFAGTVIRWLRAPIVRVALTLGAPAVVIFWLLWSIWRPAPAVDKRTARAARSRHRREDRADGEPAAGGVAELERAVVGGEDAPAGGEAQTGARHVRA